MAQVWIGQVDCTPEVRAKVRKKHGLDADEVIGAIAYGNSLKLTWSSSEKYGRRLVARGTLDGGREVVAYLHPVDEGDGHYRLGTAILGR